MWLPRETYFEMVNFCSSPLEPLTVVHIVFFEAAGTQTLKQRAVFDEMSKAA